MGLENSAVAPDPRHRHRGAPSTPRDASFLAVFLLTFFGLVGGMAALSWLVDPLAAFGTGLLPPAISADRDYKAGLYNRLPTPPSIVIIGSSRSKTIRPACINQLTGEPAFNFGVNGAAAEDYLAIFRWLHRDPNSAVHEILLGVDPEALQDTEGPHRPLADSRALRGLVAGMVEPHRWNAVAEDLWSGQSIVASARSLRYAVLGQPDLPSTRLSADGVEEYPRFDAQVRAGTFAQDEQVRGSIPGILPRYSDFARLSSRRLGLVVTMLQEARDARIQVTAFIPPIHPELERAGSGGYLAIRSNETADTLRGLDRAGLLHYVEARDLASFGGNPAWYYDALHFMPANADRLVALLLGRQTVCAVQ